MTHDRSCKTISKSLNQIKKHLSDFSDLLASSNFYKEVADQACKLQEELDQEIPELYEKIGPESLFVEKLEDPKIWGQISEILNRYFPDDTFDDIEEIIDKSEVVSQINNLFPPSENLTLTTHSLTIFWRKLSENQTFNDNLENCLKKTNYQVVIGNTKADILFKYLFQSILINNYIQENTVIEIDKLPNDFCSHFGFNLPKGKLKIQNSSFSYNLGAEATGGEIYAKETDAGLGLKLNGGKIFVDKAEMYAGALMRKGKIKINNKAESYAGEEMTGGFIDVKKATNYLGDNMEGGVILADEAGDHLGDGAKGGVIICKKAGNETGPRVSQGKTKFTALIDKYSSANLPFTGTNSWLYNYDEISAAYGSVDNSGWSSISSMLSINSNLTAFHEQKSGLYVIDLKDRRTEEFAEDMINGMSGGILVFRGMFTPIPIGKGMKDGVIIIENEDTKTKEGRDYLRRDIDSTREGGVILARIPDPDHPGKTKLIDLEEEEDE